VPLHKGKKQLMYISSPETLSPNQIREALGKEMK